MTWAKDLLFFAIIGTGVAGMVNYLRPPPMPRALTQYSSRQSDIPDFAQSVDKLNQSFRSQWSEHHLTPSPVASDLQVARRISLGLMGTVPSLEEIRQFEALPPGDRLTWWIDHTLKDRRFGDYFAERLARAYVGTEDGPFLLFRRRRFVTWLADEVMNNRPYNELARELISGQGLWTGFPATNFITVTSMPDMGNQPDPVRLAGRVTRAFLGLRLDCAQCHDHPFAAWKQTDFEGFSAFFGQTHVNLRGVQDGDGEYEILDRKTQQKRLVHPAVPSHPELLPPDGTRRQQLAGWVTHAKNPYFAKAIVNRVWAILCGKPLVDPVDYLESAEEPHPALKILTDDFVNHGYDLQRLIRVIVASEIYHLDSTGEEQESLADKLWSRFPMTRLRPEQVAGGVAQSAAVATLDAETHIAFRLIKFGQQNDFIKRYGDTGEDEFEGRGGTIPQRLLMMNGKLVEEKIKQAPFNASTRIAWMVAEPTKAIELAYLACLTRRPTDLENQHFLQLLGDTELGRPQRLEDLYWSLLNSTEFSWNH